jgi:hypothetical protein
MEVRQSNSPAFEMFSLNLKELQGWEGLTGWAEDNKYPAGQQVAYIAQLQEFGHGPIPPRPFMRPAIAKNEDRWYDHAAMQAERILEGKITGKDAMTKLAKLAAEDIQQSIDDVKSPPLSDITLWARYYRKKMGRPINGSTIGEIAGKLKSGELSGKPPGVSDKPLIDTEQMILGVIGEAHQV